MCPRVRLQVNMMEVAEAFRLCRVGSETVLFGQVLLLFTGSHVTR